MVGVFFAGAFLVTGFLTAGLVAVFAGAFLAGVSLTPELLAIRDKADLRRATALALRRPFLRAVSSLL